MEHHFLLDVACRAQGAASTSMVMAELSDSPSPAHATCHPDLMFQSEGKGADFFLSVHFKEINTE